MNPFKNIVFVAAAVAITAACNIVGPAEEGRPEAATVSVSFTAEAPGTRAAFTQPDGDSFPVLWQEGDRVKIFLNGSEVNPSSGGGVAAAELSGDGKSARFVITLPDPGALESFNYGALCPAASFSGLDKDSRQLSVTIPSQQQSSVLSPDPRAMLLWAAAGPYGDIHDTVKLPFRHLTAYVRLSLTGLTGTLREVDLVSDRDLAGEYSHPSQTNPLAVVETLAPVSPVDRVRITATDPGAVWLACAPGDWSGSTLQVTAVTSEGTFSKTVTFPSERNLLPGHVAHFSVDMSSATGKTDVFDEGHIAFSFGAVSDVHINDPGNAYAQKFLRALNQLKARADVNDADGLDAVVVAGDLTDTPSKAYAQTGYYKSLYEQVFDPKEVPMIYTVGNHDANSGYRWNPNTVMQAAVMAQVLGDDYFLTDQDQSMRTGFECRHNLVAGYHVLSLTPTGMNPVTYPAETKAWLDATLQSLTAADPERFVFVNTHPMIENTVYGSLLGTTPGVAQSDIWYSSAGDYWATHDLTAILDKYPQVVTFGGHLHFPIHDPRSIWQGDFTAFGCGSVRYMAIENGKYEDMKGVTEMNDSEQVSDGWLIQLDINGNLRATALDFMSDEVIGTPYEIPYPHADKSHLTRYGTDRKDRNQPPVFSEGNLCSLSQPSPASPVFLSWEAARDDEMVHHYVMEVLKDGSAILTKKYLADFYLHPQAADMSKTWSASLGRLAPGTYQAVITAYDSWDASARMVRTLTVEEPQPSEPALYADIDFTDGTVTDVKGMLSIDNRGATVGPTEVRFGGQSYTVPAMKAAAGKNVRCLFKDIASSSEAAAFFGSGFSVEAMFVDRSPGAVHGVVCGTQYGGWGLAMRATGVPYFIAGEDQRNNYVAVDATAAASTSDLTHAVCVYDPFAKKTSIYINGVLSSSKAISGDFYPGVNGAFNRFCLGADISDGDASTDFNATDMVITDAKFYTGSLDATAVQAAYQAAVNALGQ